MIEARVGIVSVLRRYSVGAVLLLIALPVQAQVEQVDEGLFNVMSDCWNAVDGGGLGELAPYDMAFMEIQRPRKGVENHFWSGTAQTGFGEIGVTAYLREGVLFDCTLLNDFAEKSKNTVQFSDATETLDAWFGYLLSQQGFHDTFPDLRYFGTVRCRVGELVISASAMSLGVPSEEQLAIGSTEPVPGNLRFAAFLTHPDNFDFCDGTI